MKHIKLVIILLVVNYIKLTAQWIQTGPENGEFFIKEHNGILWTIEYGSSKGLYKSTDAGQNWQRVANLLVNFRDLQFLPGKMLATTNKGIFYSIDSGATWISSNQGMQSNDTIATGCFYLTKTNSGRLITSAMSTYFSDNDGATWSNTIGSVLFTKVIETSANLTAIGSSNIYTSTNNGQNWTVGSTSGIISTDLSSMNNLFYLNNVLYLACNSLKFYNSIDNGLTWNLINSGLTGTTLGPFMVLNNIIHKRTSNGVYELNPGSNLWSLSSLSQTYNISPLGYYNNRYFGHEVFHYDGIIYTENNGLNWTNTNGINAMVVRKINTSNESYVYGESGGFLYDSLQNTYNRFTLHNTNYSSNTYAQHDVFDIKKSTNGTIYIGTAGGVWKSTNNGLSYNQFYNGIPASGATQTRNVYDMYISGAAPNDTLFAATDGGIYMSLDEAQNFTLLNGTSGNKMQQFLKYQGVLYCAGTKIYKQTIGNVWNQFTTFTNTGILGFAAADNNLFVATSNSPIKYANVNGLSNFTNIITSALGTYNAVSVAVYDTLVFFRNQNGVFKLNTSTLGSTQTSDIMDISGNLPFYFNPGNVRQYSYLNNGFGMAVFNGKLWLGTNGMSTFYRSLNDFGYNITVGENNESKKTGDEISIWPNPATDLVTIDYVLQGETSGQCMM